MLLLLKTVITLPAATLGVAMGLSASGSQTSASLSQAQDITSPTSVEIQCFGTFDVHMGLTGIPSGFLSGAATLGQSQTMTAKGGYGGTATMTIAQSLTATVGGTVQGQGTLNQAQSISAAGTNYNALTATETIKQNLFATGSVGGTGTQNGAATLTISQNIAGQYVLLGRGTLSLAQNLLGTGVIGSANPVTEIRMSFEADSIRLFWRKS